MKNPLVVGHGWGVTGTLALALISCDPGAPKGGLSPVEPSPIVDLQIAPSTAVVSVDATVRFSCTALHEDGSISPAGVMWSATCGTISSDGLYDPGASPGSFRVVASLPGVGLSDTATVAVQGVASPIVSITIDPGVASIATGAYQTFSVSAVRQDGSTLVPSVSWSATGGSITESGLYLAGGGQGVFQVVATLQAGTLSDTVAITLTAPSGGPYPNRPANFVNSREIDFSEEVPPNTTSGDRPIVGTTFAVLYDYTDSPDGLSNFARLTDTAAPHSPSGVWRLRFKAGTYSNDHGAGNIFTDESIPGGPSAVYVSLWHKVDPNYPWHPISNKFLYMVPGQVLVQINEDGKWLHGESLNAGQWLDPAGTLNGAVLLTYKNDPISRGVWHHYEVLVDKVAGVFKIWMDGDLKTSAINVRFSESYFSDVALTGHRGGGGEIMPRDGYWFMDHLFIAWP